MTARETSSTRRVLNSDQGKVVREFDSGMGEEGVRGSNHDESVGDTAWESSAEVKNMVWPAARCRDPQMRNQLGKVAREARQARREWEALGPAAERGCPATEREHGRK